jgi:hypothetical protein
MFTVAPSGSTKLATDGRMPRSRSLTSMLVASVALLELVEKAVAMIGMQPRRKATGPRPTTTFSNAGYSTNSCTR